jgi:regulation of enolase protein 1 (concanavalin A-like superfamily)
VSSVVTNPYSDWSMQSLSIYGPLTIRLTSEPGRFAKIQLSYYNGSHFIPFREVMGWEFDKNQNVDIGLYACSPGNGGFRVEFSNMVAQDFSEVLFEQNRAGLDFGGILHPNLLRIPDH